MYKSEIKNIFIWKYIFEKHETKGKTNYLDMVGIVQQKKKISYSK